MVVSSSERNTGDQLPLHHLRMKAVKESIKRMHAVRATQKRARRSQSWEMLRVVEGAAKK